jgi:hypothetical protein
MATRTSLATARLGGKPIVVPVHPINKHSTWATSPGPVTISLGMALFEIHQQRTHLHVRRIQGSQFVGVT